MQTLKSFRELATVQREEELDRGAAKQFAENAILAAKQGRHFDISRVPAPVMRHPYASVIRLFSLTPYEVGSKW
jgi:hypothetical protein